MHFVTHQDDHCQPLKAFEYFGVYAGHSLLLLFLLYSFLLPEYSFKITSIFLYSCGFIVPTKNNEFTFVLNSRCLNSSQQKSFFRCFHVTFHDHKFQFLQTLSNIFIYEIKMFKMCSLIETLSRTSLWY